MILLIMIILGVILVILNVIFNKKYLMIAIALIIICIPVYLFVTLPNGYSVEEANIEDKSLADSISKLSKDKGIDITEFAKIKISGNIDTYKPIAQSKEFFQKYETYILNSRNANTDEVLNNGSNEDIRCVYKKDTIINVDFQVLKNKTTAYKWYKIHKAVYNSNNKIELIDFEGSDSRIYVNEINDVTNNTCMTNLIFQKSNSIISIDETRKIGQPSDINKLLEYLVSGLKRLGTKQ